MAIKHKLIHIDDVKPESMQGEEGWSISEFRLPITGADGNVEFLMELRAGDGEPPDLAAELEAGVAGTHTA